MIDKEKLTEILKTLKLKFVDDVDMDEISYNDKLDLIDCEGYKYKLSIDILRNSVKRHTKLSRFFRNNPYTIYNINNYIKINNINIKLITEEINSATEKVEWFCNIHNKKFTKSWNTIKNGQLCAECGMDEYKNKRKLTVTNKL